jgi:hypothetical protein
MIKAIVRDKRKTRMAFMMRQELISQKVRPRLFSKGQTQSWIRTRSAGDYNNSEENTYIAAPTAVSYSPVASKIRLAAPAIPLKIRADGFHTSSIVASGLVSFPIQIQTEANSPILEATIRK